MSDTILEVTAEGEFIWHQNADELIESGDFSGIESMPHILRRLRDYDRLAAENTALRDTLERIEGSSMSMYATFSDAFEHQQDTARAALKKGEGK